MLADAAAWPACPAPGLQGSRREGGGWEEEEGLVKEGRGGGEIRWRKEDGKREEKVHRCEAVREKKRYRRRWKQSGQQEASDTPETVTSRQAGLRQSS